MTEDLTPTQITNKININKAFVDMYRKQHNDILAPQKIHAKMDRIKELLNMLGDPKVWGQRCPTCGTQDRDAFNFRDEISVDEFKISGMCQRCQDSVFKK